MTSRLDQRSVSTLKGVGPALAGKLGRVGIDTLQDVLFHLPFRYEDRTRVSTIGSIRQGDSVVLEGEVIACDVAFGRRRSLLAYLEDGTGRVGLRFYHFSKAQQANLSKGTRIQCYGEVRRGAAGLEIYHPEYHQTDGTLMPDKLTPVYPATEGLTQLRMRTLVAQVLVMMKDGTVLQDLLTEHQTPRLTEAITLIHNPPADADVDLLNDGMHPAQQRLAFEELLAHQVSMRLLREHLSSMTSPAFSTPGSIYDELAGGFNFDLTAAQRRVAEEIATDLQSSSPTLRLVQGDVGSGKTVIAALAAVHAIESGYQVALMAPTEILAEQHFVNMTSWLAPLGINTAWLSGKVKGTRRKQELGAIGTGSAALAVGTHALFQDEVSFSNLGLIIIDEQHRFGVHQRMALRDKGADKTDVNERDNPAEQKLVPHQLVMTATPIPRTLTMSLYADMDSSIIDELPPGRAPVTTSVLPETKRASVIERIHAACREGTQAYWVCTLIEESDVLQCQAAEVTHAELSEVLEDLSVGLVHGRMSSTQKAEVMQQFKEGALDLLVATTVIEVGVDVPNASLMVIENSERLGLTQLHQLRGRVGRGTTQSYCLLLYQSPLGETGKRRLNVMRSSTDGFFIAEQDLLIRGPGDLLGSRQSGMLNYRIADLTRDAHLLDRVKVTAQDLLRNDREIAEALVNRWLASPDEYGQV